MTASATPPTTGTERAVRSVTTLGGLRQVARYVSWHPRPFLVAMGGALLYAAMTVASAVVIGRVVDQVVLPVFGGEALTSGHVVLIVGGVLGVGIIRSAGVLGRRYYAGMLSEQVQTTLRRSLAGQYLAVPVDWIERRSVGTLLAHAEADVETAGQSLHPVPLSAGAVAIVVLAFVVMVLTDVVLAAIGLVLFPLLVVANQVYSRVVAPPMARVQDGLGVVSSIANESFDGALVVKTLGREEAEGERFEAAATALRDERISVGYVRAVFETVLDVLPTAGMIAVVVVGAYRVDAGLVSAGDLVLIVTLFNILVFPMRVFGFLLESLPGAVVAQGRIDRALEPVAVGAPPAGIGAPPAGVAAAPAGAREASPTDEGAAGVAFRSVRFGYTENEIVLNDFDLEVAPGEVLALVGPTGAGKSSIVELVAGLRRPTSGSVTVNGRPAVETLGTAAVAVAFQEAFLFAGTITDNLDLGRGIDPAELRAAAQVAEADGFIRDLPDGYDTMVGERGVTLSGGQRQRVALARALAGRPDVLVADDATSAVDPRIEQRILDRLRTQRQVTTILVAQRVATIALADRVAFVVGGRVQALGAHDELLATEPAYEALVRAYE